MPYAHEIPATYEIVCLATGKRYVGSSIDVLNRLAQHKSELRSDRHTNAYLQRAFNKYGEDEFVFRPLNVINGGDMETVRAHEQMILTYNALTNNRGFNLNDTATGGSNHPDVISRMVKTKRPQGYPIVVDPVGREHRIENLSAFCRTYGLHTPGMRRMVNGVRQQYKGWHLVGTVLPEMRIHKLISPNGQEFTFENTTAFANEHGLDQSQLCKMLNGKADHHKGWTLKKD